VAAALLDLLQDQTLMAVQQRLRGGRRSGKAGAWSRRRA
jgi:hypothetical protein